MRTILRWIWSALFSVKISLSSVNVQYTEIGTGRICTSLASWIPSPPRGRIHFKSVFTFRFKVIYSIHSIIIHIKKKSHVPPNFVVIYVPFGQFFFLEDSKHPKTDQKIYRDVSLNYIKHFITIERVMGQPN